MSEEGTSKRYTVQCGDDYFLLPCPFNDPLVDAPSWHWCVEIPDEVVNDWKRTRTEYYAVQRVIREYRHKQGPHRLPILASTAAVYKDKQS